MNYTYSDPTRKEIRQQLRRCATQPEQLLWRYLRGRQTNGLKFRRQHGVGLYILDFYCPELRLAIELDGDSHYSELGAQQDMGRDMFLQKHNIKTVRFTNHEVMTNIEGVLSVIRSYHP